MVKKSYDYSKSKIFLLKCKTNPHCVYVGTTTKPLEERYEEMRRDYYNLTQIFYNHIYHIDKNWDNWYIELYEEYPCKTIKELNKKLSEVIKEKGNLNYKLSGKTLGQYMNDVKQFYVK